MAKGKYQEWLEPDGLLKLKAWARDGLTDEQIAKNMGVSVKTLFNYKTNHLPILHALKRGKEIVDIEVENALLNNARGFKYTEQVISTRREVLYEDGKRIKEISEPVIVEVEKYKQPETTAQIYWLKNRRPDKWRDKQYIEDTDTDLVKEFLTKLTGGGTDVQADTETD